MYESITRAYKKVCRLEAVKKHSIVHQHMFCAQHSSIILEDVSSASNIVLVLPLELQGSVLPPVQYQLGTSTVLLVWPVVSSSS